MPKKRYIKIPRVISIKCRNCGKISRRKAENNECPQYFDCDKCGQRMFTPPSSCCIICAFTGKKCPASLVMESKTKGWGIR